MKRLILQVVVAGKGAKKVNHRGAQQEGEVRPADGRDFFARARREVTPRKI